MKKYIVIAGNIGVGKSTLVEMLCRREGWTPYYEPVSENPYLEDFYADMSRWAFHSQIYFLTHRVHAHHQLASNPLTVVQDRSVYEDAEVFAKNLFRTDRLTAREWETYRGLYKTVVAMLPAPDLVVYLEASVPTLQHRIGRRSRPMERSIGTQYLEDLNALYSEWAGSFDLAPVLRVPCDRLDFVAQPTDLSTIVSAVDAALLGAQGVLFPLDPPHA